MKNTSLQNNITKKLSNKKMSVSELERRCGLKQSAVQNILHGRSKNPSVEMIKSIAQELGCSIEELIKEASVSKESNSLPWYPGLFIQSIESMQKILQEKGRTHPSKEQAIACAEEIYKYSLENPEQKVDDRFAEWLIERFYK